jgi:hypothetical protein
LREASGLLLAVFAHSVEKVIRLRHDAVNAKSSIDAAHAIVSPRVLIVRIAIDLEAVVHFVLFALQLTPCPHGNSLNSRAPSSAAYVVATSLREQQQENLRATTHSRSRQCRQLMERTMLTQTEIRPAAGDVLKNWPIEAPVQKPSTHVSAAEYREALSRVASSVSIVSTDGAHGIAGFTCSAVCAVTDEPPTIMVCINRKSAANAVIKANGVLCVSSLGAEQVRS